MENSKSNFRKLRYANVRVLVMFRQYSMAYDGQFLNTSAIPVQRIVLRPNSADGCHATSPFVLIITGATGRTGIAKT